MMVDLKKSFVAATKEFNTAEKYIPLPLFRKVFTINNQVKQTMLYISSLGYYEVHINGNNITKGYMAPYRSNPEHYIYYDIYDITKEIKSGKNAIGVILGNGIQNSIAWNWEFDKLPWRSAPAISFQIEIIYENGSKEIVSSDEEMRTKDSPIIFNDFHFGEHFDARLIIPDWDMPDFDDSDWEGAIKVSPNEGELKLCEAEPIVETGRIFPKSITKCNDGYIYDFGENNSGFCKIEIEGEAGQKLVLHHVEIIKDGKPYADNIVNDNRGKEKPFQIDEYICCGNGTEVHIPRFTYHGFRYVYIEGITAKQATERLLTFITISSDIKKIGSFSCDDEMINKIQEATARSDISNFHYFPTDCPHREKNGWTADAALSAEQVLLNYTPEKSYREWLLNIYKAMKENGQLPGIIPTGTWGYKWGNGPAWDSVIVYLPYYTYVYRGDRRILEECASPLMKYLGYLYEKLDENDLLAFGLGDWCQPGKEGGRYDTPLIVTDSIVSVDIARKSEFIFEQLGMDENRAYAQKLRERITAGIRKNLIKDGLVEGKTQTGQAMALYYGLVEDREREKAFSYLLDFIDEKEGHLYTGVLGARVIFRLLSDNGYGNLAYKMITRTDFPSYGNWIARGATTLWERFWDEGERPYSMNHHFWGDVSAWFYTYLGGIRINPTGTDVNNIDIVPLFVDKLNFVNAKTACTDGEICVEWKRIENNIVLQVDVPENIYGKITLPKGFTFKDNEKSTQILKAGTYLIVQQK